MKGQGIDGGMLARGVPTLSPNSGWVRNSPAGPVNTELGQLAEATCARVVKGGR